MRTADIRDARPVLVKLRRNRDDGECLPHHDRILHESTISDRRLTKSSTDTWTLSLQRLQSFLQLLPGGRISLAKTGWELRDHINDAANTFIRTKNGAKRARGDEDDQQDAQQPSKRTGNWNGWNENGGWGNGVWNAGPSNPQQPEVPAVPPKAQPPARNTPPTPQDDPERRIRRDDNDKRSPQRWNIPWGTIFRWVRSALGPSTSSSGTINEQYAKVRCPAGTACRMQHAVPHAPSRQCRYAHHDGDVVCDPIKIFDRLVERRPNATEKDAEDELRRSLQRIKD